MIRFASNALQLGVIVKDVTLTLDVDNLGFLPCDCCFYVGVFWSALKQRIVRANRASLLSLDWSSISALDCITHIRFESA
jgi:hypothetical protein